MLVERRYLFDSALMSLDDAVGAGIRRLWIMKDFDEDPIKELERRSLQREQFC